MECQPAFHGMPACIPLALFAPSCPVLRCALRELRFAPTANFIPPPKKKCSDVLYAATANMEATVTGTGAKTPVPTLSLVIQWPVTSYSLAVTPLSCPLVTTAPRRKRKGAFWVSRAMRLWFVLVQAKRMLLPTAPYKSCLVQSLAQITVLIYSFSLLPAFKPSTGTPLSYQLSVLGGFRTLPPSLSPPSLSLKLPFSTAAAASSHHEASLHERSHRQGAYHEGAYHERSLQAKLGGSQPVCSPMVLCDVRY